MKCQLKFARHARRRNVEIAPLFGANDEDRWLGVALLVFDVQRSASNTARRPAPVPADFHTVASVHGSGPVGRVLAWAADLDKCTAALVTPSMVDLVLSGRGDEYVALFEPAYVRTPRRSGRL
jgi:hypothetical protein